MTTFVRQLPTIEQLLFFLPFEDCLSLLYCGARLATYVDAMPVIAARAMRNDFVAACERGILSVVRLLDRVDPSKKDETMPAYRAAACGHLDILKWMHAVDAKGFSTDTMDEAASEGHLSIVQWLHENRSEGCTIWAMNYAAGCGHLDVVQWLHKNRTEGCTEVAADWAIEYEYLETVQWLHDNRTEGCSTDALVVAAMYGYLNIVQWVMTSRWGARINIYDAMYLALEHDETAVFRYLFSVVCERRRQRHDCECLENCECCAKGCDVYMMEGAVMWKRCNIAQWLHEYCSVCYSVDKMVRAAAKHDNLTFLQSLFTTHMQGWSEEEKTRVGIRAMRKAVIERSRRVLRWVQENIAGCSVRNEAELEALLW